MMIYLPGSLRKLDPVYIEALCMIEVFTRFGLTEIRTLAAKVLEPRAAIFSDETRKEDTCLCMRVTQGDAVFTCAIGPIGCKPEEFEERWKKAVDTIQAAPAEEAMPIWEKSRVKNIMPTLAETLRKKGFVVKA